MPTVTMPQLGESVAEGTIGKWLKQVGDHVDRFEPIVEVITDKVNAEVPSPFEGILTQILVAEGQTVPNHADIAVIETADAASAVVAPAPAPAAAPPPPAPPPPPPAPPPPAVAAPPPPPPPRRGRRGRGGGRRRGGVGGGGPPPRRRSRCRRPRLRSRWPWLPRRPTPWPPSRDA